MQQASPTQLIYGSHKENFIVTRNVFCIKWPVLFHLLSLSFFFLQDHTRFVNCVRFSPDGNRFATASADGQVKTKELSQYLF